MKDSFSRTLTLKNSIYLGLSSMIGAGLFNNISPTAKVSSYASILGLIIAATVATANASSSAQLAALYPQTGGTYLYASKVLGKAYANIAGMVFIIGKTISCIAISLTVGNYLSSIYSKEFAVLISFIIVLISYFGIQKTANISKWFIWSVLIILLFYSISIVLTPGVNYNLPLFVDADISNILLSASIWFFAFTGYSRLATFGEEVKNPESIIPRAIFIGLGISISIYLTISWLTLAIVSPVILMNSKTPLLIAMDVSILSDFSYLITTGSAIAMSSVLIALLPGISRIYVAMSRDKILPKIFSKIHKNYNSAYVSEMFVFVTIILGVYFLDVVSAIKTSAFFILIYYSITNFCVLKLPSEKRLYSKSIALYGLFMCITLAATLFIV